MIGCAVTDLDENCKEVINFQRWFCSPTIKWAYLVEVPFRRTPGLAHICHKMAVTPVVTDERSMMTRGWLAGRAVASLIQQRTGANSFAGNLCYLGHHVCSPRLSLRRRAASVTGWMRTFKTICRYILPLCVQDINCGTELAKPVVLLGLLWCRIGFLVLPKRLRTELGICGIELVWVPNWVLPKYFLGRNTPTRQTVKKCLIAHRYANCCMSCIESNGQKYSRLTGIRSYDWFYKCGGRHVHPSPAHIMLHCTSLHWQRTVDCSCVFIIVARLFLGGHRTDTLHQSVYCHYWLINSTVIFLVPKSDKDIFPRAFFFQQYYINFWFRRVIDCLCTVFSKYVNHTVMAKRRLASLCYHCYLLWNIIVKKKTC